MREYEPLTALLLLLHFPSFSEGLSLRERRNDRVFKRGASFPFLFGGTFIEGFKSMGTAREAVKFPFLFGGTFIEGTAFR